MGAYRSILHLTRVIVKYDSDFIIGERRREEPRGAILACLPRNGYV